MKLSKLVPVLCVACATTAFFEVSYRVFRIWQQWEHFPNNYWRSEVIILIGTLPRLTLSMGLGLSLLLLALFTRFLVGLCGWRRRLVLTAGFIASLGGVAPVLWHAHRFASSLRSASRWDYDPPFDLQSMQVARLALVDAAYWSVVAWGIAFILLCCVSPRTKASFRTQSRAFLLAFAVSVLLLLGTRPVVTESENLLDERFRYAAFRDETSINEVGPDEVQEAPTVELREGTVILDGIDATDAEAFYEALKYKRELWKSVAPDQIFPGRVNWALGPSATVTLLTARLKLSLRAGYSEHHILLQQDHHYSGPLLGEQWGHRFTSLQGHVVEHRRECKSDAPVVWWQDAGDASIHEFVSTLVQSRGRGTAQCWVVGPLFRQLSAELQITTQTLAGDIDLSHIEVDSKNFDTVLLPATCLHPWNCTENNKPKAHVETRLMQQGSDFPKLEEQLAHEGRELIFAMNAGMFHANHQPVGLLIQNDKFVADINLDNGEGNFFLKPNGVWGATSSRFFVEESKKFADEANSKWSHFAVNATQSGPLLLNDRVRNPNINANSPNRKIRNGVGVDSQGNTMFAISNTPVTLFDLTHLFDSLGCSNALYLDGVVSALYVPQKRRLDSGRGLGPIVFATVPKTTSNLRQ